jgi:hypothetical protein
VLRGSLDDDRVWGLFDRLAHGTEDEARSLLETAPTQVAPRHRPRYAELVVEVAGFDRSRVREEAFGALGAWAPWSPDAPDLAADAIEELATGAEWRAAIGALIEMLRDRAGWDRLGDLVGTLAGRVDGPELDAGTDRDRPSGQRLTAVVGRLVELAFRERDRSRAELLAVADLIAAAQPICPEELAVRFAALDWQEPAAVLAAIAVRLDDHPLLAPQAMAQLGCALDRDRPDWDPTDLAATADRLIAAGSVGAGALASQLVATAGLRAAWPEEWRARLRALRTHSHADVATLARGVLTAPE